jgi:hypothetical protein
MSDLPKHLGGHFNFTNNDFGAFQYIKQKFNIKSMVDIGCGPGGMLGLAQGQGVKSLGIDGDFTLEYPEGLDVRIHDFTTNTIEVDMHDLGWSVEFLEHIEEQYLVNVFPVFKKCKYIVCTHALPGQPGHHHVNCQSPEYWLDVFSKNGFEFDEATTNEVRENSTLNYPNDPPQAFMRKTGLFFINKDRR